MTKERVNITGQVGRRQKIKGQRRFLIFATLFVLLILAPIGLNQYYKFLLEPASKNGQSQIFVIKPGQPLNQIADNLEKANIIKNALAFRLLVSQMGISKNIQAGDFRLSRRSSAREIAQELTHGAIDVWVTLPEGLRLEEQAQKIEEKLKFGSNEKFRFDKKEFVKISKEGYMFPDTYLISKDAGAKDISDRLLETFRQKASSLPKSGQASNLSEDEVVTLASIIEREARTNEERPVIAGILLNRLQANMPLQVDATIQFAKGYDNSQNTWWPKISAEDYSSIKSPYNTYLFVGLPPSPISSPGLESIRAASQPTSTDYFYYLHDSNGKIHYAKTSQEHNKNIQEFL